MGNQEQHVMQTNSSNMSFPALLVHNPCIYVDMLIKYLFLSQRLFTVVFLALFKFLFYFDDDQ